MHSLLLRENYTAIRLLSQTPKQASFIDMNADVLL